MHETGLGHIIGQQLGELMVQGERSRCLSCYIGPLFSDMERTLQEKGLGSKGDAGAYTRSLKKSMVLCKKSGRGEMDAQAVNFNLTEGPWKNIQDEEKTQGPVMKGRS